MQNLYSNIPTFLQIKCLHVNCIFLVVKRKDHLEQIVTQTVESRRGTKLLVLCTQERYLAWCLAQCGSLRDHGTQVRCAVGVATYLPWYWLGGYDQLGGGCAWCVRSAFDEDVAGL